MENEEKKGIAVVCLLVFCWSILYVQWKDLSVYAYHTGIRTEQGCTVEAVENYLKKQDASNQKVTAWSCRQNATISSVRGAQQAAYYRIYGQMGKVFPFPMVYGSYPYQTDENGCVVTSGLAQKLYGAVNVVGQKLVYGKKEWQIRGVLKAKDSFFAVCTNKKQEKMKNLEVVGNKQSSEPSLLKLTNQLEIESVSYTVYGSLVQSVSRLFLGLPIVFLLFVYRRKYRTKMKGQKKWVWWMALVIVLVGTVRLPEFLIPSSWSDFDFWSQQFAQMQKDIRVQRHASEIYWETDVRKQLVKMLTNLCIQCLVISKLNVKEKK
ncbi:MAG: ABC transporter permease [Lachnospiraceae bacterium]